jgi:hypothetical protein
MTKIIGPEELIRTYLSEVNQAEGFIYTTNWSEPQKHYKKELWAIEKHPSHPAPEGTTEQEELERDWRPPEI